MSLELLGLGLDFVGGLFGMSNASKNRQLQAQQMAQAQRQFDAQMDQSVQRRTADAKKAGIHPLFALGGSVGASPTVSAGQSPQGGNPMGNALARMAAQLGVIEQNKASAKRDEAEAALMDSERARINSDLNAQGRDTPGVAGPSVKTFPYGGNLPMELGPGEYYNPQVATSQRPGVASGTHPSRIEAMDEFGNRFTLPSPDLGLDEIGQIEYALYSVSQIPKEIKAHWKAKKELGELERELTRLRNARQNPRKVKEFNALKRKAKRKLRQVYNYFRR